MSDCTRWSFQRKIDWFRCQFAQHASLPFSEVLPAQVIVIGHDDVVLALLRVDCTIRSRCCGCFSAR